MAAGLVIRDAVPGDREAALSFWPHPDRFDRRLASSAIGDESLLVAVLDDASRPQIDVARPQGEAARPQGDVARPQGDTDRPWNEAVRAEDSRVEGHRGETFRGPGCGASKGETRDDGVRREGGSGDGGLEEAGGAVAGIVSVRWGGGCSDASRPLLYALEVRPELRGRGVGTGLIRHVAGLVVGRGYAEITLEVEVDNAGAIRLYRRLGFTMTGPHQHFWYFGEVSGSVEVLIMHGRAGHLAHP
ncbi:MAG TPA: GNAT family N-acetyltransferase [Actinoplanes sp.]|nr:GNAT family N-acetyltransferase [Actinoplanes sp.]